MNVREIVATYLAQHGYDGLFNNDCGCLCDDLGPCDNGPMDTCQPGYRVACKRGDCDECAWWACDGFLEGTWRVQREKSTRGGHKTPLLTMRTPQG
jgi:hypothetical protein